MKSRSLHVRLYSRGRPKDARRVLFLGTLRPLLWPYYTGSSIGRGRSVTGFNRGVLNSVYWGGGGAVEGSLSGLLYVHRLVSVLARGRVLNLGFPVNG